MHKAVKKLSSRFKYPPKYSKGKFSLGEMAKNATKNTTPYIAINWYYDSEFGVIKQKTINKFNTNSKFL